MSLFSFEGQAIHQQHQNTTFLNTNAGRLGLFVPNTWLRQHGTNYAAICSQMKKNGNNSRSMSRNQDLKGPACDLDVAVNKFTFAVRNKRLELFLVGYGLFEL